MEQREKVCFMCGATEFKYMVIDQAAGITYYQCRDCGWEDVIINFDMEEGVL